MLNFTGEVKENSQFTIQWKRGPSKEETKPFSLDPAHGSININQSFVRYSMIYKDGKTGKYLKKMVSIPQRLISYIVLIQIEKVGEWNRKVDSRG
mgnify:CR=1 FL=1